MLQILKIAEKKKKKHEILRSDQDDKIALDYKTSGLYAVALAVIVWITLPTPYHLVKSLQLIWRSGTRNGTWSSDEL